MARAGTAGRRRKERKQSRTSESDRPVRTHEGPTMKDSSRNSKQKGQSEREEERKAKERGGRKKSGYSPDTSLVRGVGALKVGR